MAAVACDKLDMVQAIVKQNPEFVNYVGSTDPLHRLRYVSTFTTTRTPVTGVTPLHIAAGSYGKHSLEIFEILVENGADVNAVDGQHTSALKWAFISKNKPIIQKLIELNESDPFWRGKINGAGKASQITRGLIKAPKKVLGSIGKAAVYLPGKIGQFALNSLKYGRKRTTRKQRSQKNRTTRRNH